MKDQSGKSGFKFNEIRVVPTPDIQVNQIAWKDNALVVFLSTVFKGDERCERWRKRPSTTTSTARPIQRFFSDEPVKLISIPTVAAAYNDEMNHVDRGDQRRAYQGYDHAIRRGASRALTWTFLLDVVLVNSFLLQLHGQPHWKRYTNQKDWRRRIHNDLSPELEEGTAVVKPSDWPTTPAVTTVEVYTHSGDSRRSTMKHKFVRRGKIRLPRLSGPSAWVAKIKKLKEAFGAGQ
ncbi:hypothetical protein MRS44_013135 [Fusarium solani]|uniref:uncharacterized protein n=1 Tax=Fusarium solani TaxID=169388 RepID=UPI0032C43B8B|nr:hypothetical protein MRS44_013135 [Fusarium solani]